MAIRRRKIESLIEELLAPRQKGLAFSISPWKATCPDSYTGMLLRQL